MRLGTNWWALYGGGVGDGQKNYFVQNGRMGHTFYELGIVMARIFSTRKDESQAAETTQ